MSRRISLFDISIDVVSMSNAVGQLSAWLDEQAGVCRFVVTPNVDHAVMLQHNEQLREVYRNADLVLADGFPLVLASKLVRKPLPERVAGSELVPAVFDAAARRRRPLRVFLLGAAPGVADRAAGNVHRNWPNVQVVGTYSPPLGFESDDDENAAILQRIADASPEVLVVGLGAPKQEIWVCRHRHHLQVRVALCVGATIDFLAGEKRQAPRWMRRAGLEWLHRMASEPRRLVGRYARDAWIFPRLVWREWLATVHPGLKSTERA